MATSPRRGQRNRNAPNTYTQNPYEKGQRLKENGKDGIIETVCETRKDGSQCYEYTIKFHDGTTCTKNHHETSQLVSEASSNQKVRESSKKAPKKQNDEAGAKPGRNTTHPALRGKACLKVSTYAPCYHPRNS